MEELIMEERKEKIKMYINSSQYLPTKRTELSILLDVPAQERLFFEDIINELIQQGDIIETKKGKLMSPKSLNMVLGTFISHSKGFGFVETEIKKEKDIFIPADFTNGAMHKDKVLCRITKPIDIGKRAEGEIVQVIKRGSDQIVGTFEMGKGFGFVVPDDKKMAQDIFIPYELINGAVTGHKVVVKVTKFPEGRRNPEGKVIEILGHVDDPGVDILSIIRQYNLAVEFPDDVLKQLDFIPMEVSEEELQGREDLRNLKMVTIDGEDAKDLDDAVSLEILENGNFSLGVHIADVSHYVKENSPLDKEAYARGTSIYLVDRVIPMLPHKLSNGICSLNPNVDRLALSCIMEIDYKGTVVSHKILQSVIHSNRRMTYTAVREILEDKTPALLEEYKDLIGMFEDMEKLRQILNTKRKKRGSVNFDLPESKIILDENGKPLEIKPYDRSIATNLIEEFMLICNETVAEDYFWQETPFLFRNHEVPSEEKMKRLEEFVKGFGYRLKGSGDLHPKAIQQILQKVEGKPEEHVISRIALRSMMQAKYMSENLGHFGLAAKYYCHFTSPIRRYPDLEIHRIIKENIHGKLSEKRIHSLKRKMPDIAKQCSLRERVAEDAERDTDNLKKVEFMEDKIGNIYEGIISGVTSWGVYVELPNTVEGMVSNHSMDDDLYIFDQEHMLLQGEHSHKRYRLGDRVFVQVVKVNKELKTIDFIFTEEEIQKE